MGKGIYYRNAPTGTIIHPFSLPTLKLVVVDSGTSASTIEMVNMVQKSMIHSKTKETVDEIGILTNKIYEELTGAVSLERLGTLFNDNHRALRIRTQHTIY